MVVLCRGLSCNAGGDLHTHSLSCFRGIDQVASVMAMAMDVHAVGGLHSKDGWQQGLYVTQVGKHQLWLIGSTAAVGG